MKLIFTSRGSADSNLKKAFVDVFFLDLNIFGSVGFEILGRISKSFVNTIVVSANTDNAVRAYE
ncbi:hypothetical protein ND856_13840 [Leptospira bandrabouensis]|uniref:hypothetical protein n=1 Tax=Leptospira bandrabouensis TaxID=2484903 RepID=UPI001EE801BC|nr:hypothetical protein [Leptospira bandrabouensis]MCG6145588.1 hypothetical protein [Leptospira bandrabouensis]MCG6160872.1 hypothetical protein [Leptospira bandrabouensis]MCG6165410.1 hypothetical protein [Leptospira bandrabouensis]MCW7460192.1 hypothetical protein [Leptospira bandrabouensis]MCW7478371.1 hypothetical protein [Leptospira bandrabouensis]